jgi:hypothetical protein
VCNEDGEGGGQLVTYMGNDLEGVNEVNCYSVTKPYYFR